MKNFKAKELNNPSYSVCESKIISNSFDMLNPEFIYIETDGVEYAKTIEKDDEDVNRSENT